MKKVLSVLGDIVVSLVLVFAVLITVMVISSTKSEAKVPSLFGYAIMNVETDSMEGPNGFYVGDLIVIRLVDEEEANNLSVGTVITFKRFYSGSQYIETHRIVKNTFEIYNEHEVVDGIRVHNGVKSYVTKGDNTPAVDYLASGELDYATKNTIIGVWEGKSIPKLGSAIKFLQSQMGFMVCIVAPLALLFFYQLYSFIVTMNEKKKEKALEEVAASQEEIRQKAIAEFMAQQQATQESKADESNAKAAEAATPAEPPAPAADEEELKKKTIEEYLAKQKAAEEQAAKEEEIKKKAIEEYLAKQAAEAAANDSATSDDKKE